MLAQFSTPRLNLNLIAESDHELVLELLNSDGWLQFIGNRNVYSETEAIGYIKKLLGTPQLYYWVVKLANNQQAIGIVSYLKRAYLDHFDIGFAFLPPYQGSGYAYEAAATVLANVGKIAGHQTIQATTLPNNEKSISLLTRLGFAFEKEITHENELLLVYKLNALES